MREASWDDFPGDDEQAEPCSTCEYSECICDYITDVLKERELDDE